MRRYLQTALISLFMLPACVAMGSSIDFSMIETLPPGEQYRQLSLVLMITAGADPVLVERLLESSPQDGKGDPEFDPDAYKTPLTRIVDQRSMLNGAAVLLQFANRSRLDIRSKLAAIEKANPVLISMLNTGAVSEDAIIIRNAIADSISYSGLADEKTTGALLEAYRTRTLRLRNDMEFSSFREELDRITAESIRTVGGQSDAYQRMFDDEVVAKGFRRQIETADYIYKRDREFDKHAAEMTEEIIKNVVESQSEVNH